MRHYMTKYRTDQNELRVVSWMQINIFGKCFCMWKKELAIPKDS